MKTYTAKEAKQNFGAFIEDGQKDIALLTRNGRPIGSFINQEETERVIARRQRQAQLKILEALQELHKASEKFPKPTREEMKDLLECDDDEIDALVGEDYFANTK